MSVNFGSTVRGILAMRSDRGTVNVKLELKPKGFWLMAWTPVWHEGRGPYISVGFGFGAFYRGY